VNGFGRALELAGVVSVDVDAVAVDDVDAVAVDGVGAVVDAEEADAAVPVGLASSSSKTAFHSSNVGIFVGSCFNVVLTILQSSVVCKFHTLDALSPSSVLHCNATERSSAWR